MKEITKILLITLLFFIVGGFTVVSAATNADTEFEENNGALQYIQEIEELLMENFDSLNKFNENGGMYFDEKGVAHIGLKKQSVEHTRLAEEIGNVVGENYIEIEEVTYSNADLDNIKESILKEIIYFLPEDEFKKSYFSIDASFSEQKLVLTYDYGGLPDDLINKLKTVYQNILLFEEIDFELSTNKGRKEDWNQQVSGLGVKLVNGKSCSTGGVFYKAGNYFVSTAAHCFTSNTSPTGGDLVRQFNTNIGIQHAAAGYYGYDIGLIRITSVSTLPRYATSGLKRAESGTYNSRFSSWSNVYTGQTACKSGITSQQTCGTVNNANTTVKYPTETYTFKVAKVGGLNWSLGGDSGAGVYNNVSGSTTSYLGNVSGNYKQNGIIQGGYFTKFNDVRNHYDVSLYISTNNYKVVN